MRHVPALFALAFGLACQAASADDLHSVRLYWAKSSETDLATVVIGDFKGSPESNYLAGATWGAPISDTLFGLPFAVTGHLGAQYFKERGYQDDGFGGTAFVKANYRWELPFTDMHIVLGLGEGLSYVSRIPISEVRDFAKKDAESAKLMNYLEWTTDVPLTQFETFKPLLRHGIKEISLGFIVWHRSSVFGIFSETKGGVNFMGFSVEARY